MCWRKWSSANQNNTNTSRATLHVGAQAMIVCFPAILNIADNYAKEELDPNTFSLRRFQSHETTSVAIIEEARSCTAADTAITTQAEIHQYSNVDTSGDSGDAESNEEEMLYGIATANSVYEDTNLNQSNSTSHYHAQPENINSVPEHTSTTEDLGILYRSCTATITDE
ncbi:hypothetical protein Bbelb_355430 [Branchiostoma belcheri]|nr:hypothetical protein Bbelb_355430 [Branchiostoma belcheri]